MASNQMHGTHVYKSANKVAARKVNPVIKATAHEIGARAAAVLATHRDTGLSKITVEKANRFDYFVILDDTAHEFHSSAIEYGRRTVPHPSRGVWALHRASGLPME